MPSDDAKSQVYENLNADVKSKPMRVVVYKGYGAQFHGKWQRRSGVLVVRSYHL